MAKLGATSSIDRFAQAQTWTRLESDETVYDGLRAWVRCEIIERVPAGESTVFIARALESHVARDVAPDEAGDALGLLARRVGGLCCVGYPCTCAVHPHSRPSSCCLYGLSVSAFRCCYVHEYIVWIFRHC